MSIIEKINKKYSVNLIREEIQYILDFSLLWNLFEKEYFKKRFRKDKIRDSLNCFRIETDLLDDSFGYFKDSYILDWEKNGKSKYLNIRSSKEVEEITENLINDKDKLYTIILIISRFRNNLFHWEKRIELIDWQKENFKVANNFLVHLLDLSE